MMCCVSKAKTLMRAHIVYKHIENVHALHGGKGLHSLATILQARTTQSQTKLINLLQRLKSMNADCHRCTMSVFGAAARRVRGCRWRALWQLKQLAFHLNI